MSDFLRPEARAALWRWREVLIGGAVALVGLALALGTYGPASWLGWAVTALGGGLIFTGLQHIRFRSEGQGPGMVEINERRVTYYGPLTGGVADLDLLDRLDLVPGIPAHWQLTAESGATLAIPVNAAGAEELFDVFAALPGIRTEAMLAALRSRPKAPVTVWSARAPAHRAPALTPPPPDGTR